MEILMKISKGLLKFALYKSIMLSVFLIVVIAVIVVWATYHNRKEEHR
jgi:cell division protein FtsL